MPSAPVIAVVDDEPRFRNALRRLLVAHGFPVLTFDRGEDAMVALTTKPVDCLLYDLPEEGDGEFTFLEAIRTLRPETELIVIVGPRKLKLVDGMRAVGVKACLEKPVDESDLLAAIG